MEGDFRAVGLEGWGLGLSGVLIVRAVLLCSALALTASAVCAQGASQPPSPTSTKPATKPQAKASEAQTAAELDKRATKAQPAIIEILKAPVIHVEATDKTERHHDYTSSEWWLVYLTGVLAAVTLGLAWYTGRLYRATVDLGKEARNTSERQAGEVERSLKIGKESAAAAARSADSAERSLLTAQRAFVFVEGISQMVVAPNGQVSEYGFSAKFANVGITPARNCRYDEAVHICAPSDPIPRFPINGMSHWGSPSVIGPKMEGRTNWKPVAIDALRRCFRGEVAIYFWIRLEYQDVFTSDVRHHELCAKIFFTADPISLPPTPQGPFFADFEHCGEQNTSA